MLSLTFLGTSAARPTVERGVSAIALQREGETLLFECGEGTQRQMMRYGVSFTLSEIFVSHFHADHFLGITGLVRTLGLQGREDPLHLYGPRGAKRILRQATDLGVERAPFEVVVHEVKAGDVLQRLGYDIEVIGVDHGRAALGYVVREHERLGRFNPDRARELGVPEGPLWGRLHRGETVEFEQATAGGSTTRRRVGPEELVGAPRPGRVVVYSGDTRPCKAVVDAAAGADLLVHEATFGDEERDRAKDTLHSTAVEAAQVALAARVRRLVLTHLSARYSAAPQTLRDEARGVFAETSVAKDGMVIDVPFPDEGEAGRGKGEGSASDDRAAGSRSSDEPEPVAWARVFAAVKPPYSRNLRAGTWYAVVRDQFPDRVSIVIGGEVVEVPRKVLELRRRRPTLFSVIYGKHGLPRPEGEAARGPHYAVCPTCSGRFEIRPSLPWAQCPECGHKGEIEW